MWKINICKKFLYDSKSPSRDPKLRTPAWEHNQSCDTEVGDYRMAPFIGEGAGCEPENKEQGADKDVLVFEN